jgi:IQ calmodulin-binding motif
LKKIENIEFKLLFSQAAEDIDPEFSNPAFLKAVVKIQAAFRGHQCRKMIDNADMEMFGY